MPKSEEEQVYKFAKNKAELSRILDISRVTLDAWIELPDSPRTTSNGRYVVAEWRAFKANRNLNAGIEETAELKLQKLRDEVARGQIAMLKEAGELVPVEWSKQLFAHLSISMRNVIMDSGIGEGEKLSLIAKIEKINADDYISQLRLQTVEALAGEPELNLQDGAIQSQAAA